MKLIIDIPEDVYKHCRSLRNSPYNDNSFHDIAKFAIGYGIPFDDIKTERYNNGFVDGYKKATEQANACVKKIKEEIQQVVEEEADDKRWSRGLHYALKIIDKRTGKEQ